MLSSAGVWAWHAAYRRVVRSSFATVPPWRRVHARATAAGLAFTLLRQHSPRLVDALLDGGVAGGVAVCQRHRTPVPRPGGAVVVPRVARG